MNSKNIKQQTFDFAEEKNFKSRDLDFSQPIGDPFVEIGRLGLVEFCQRDKFEEIEELKKYIEKLFKSYVFNPTKTLNQIFSDNSKFTHNSSSKDLDKRYKNSIEYFELLMNQKINGYCLSCGAKNNLSKVEKMIFPLTTGDKNVNFTSYFSGNLLMCKKCMISLFFTPINMKKVDWGKAFLISENKEINYFYTEENISEYKSNLVKNIDILPDSKINIFENFIYSTLENLQFEGLFGDITFYLISNVDRNTQVKLIHTYRKQMEFINKVAPKPFKSSLPTKQKDEWNYLIVKYSKKERSESRKKIKFDKEVLEEKKYSSIIKYYNPVIRNFIQGKSILSFLKKSKSSWNLTSLYLKEIRNMREERLETIKNVAEKLMLLNKNNDKEFIRKVVFPIEKTKSQSELRTKLREFMRKLLVVSKEPLLTADDMVFRILPQGESWQETKDILLIALYEKLSFDEEIEQEFQNLTTQGEDYE